MTHADRAIRYARDNHARYLDELKAFLSIPSISTLPQHQPDVERAARWVAAQLEQLGMQNVALMPTKGHPIVYGEWLGAAGKPTVLIYGHYDVQPVDPLDEWRAGPFEPTVRGDQLYARGAADMKSQIHGFLKALEALQQQGELPLNVKVIVEGEEEMGSPNLGAFIRDHQDKLACDLFLNTDAGIERADLPSLIYGLRGIAYFELWVHGPEQDLHSGLYGGSVANPAHILSTLIAGMHDERGHITLPGFYEKVRVLSADERAEINRFPFSEEAWRKSAGVPQLSGEEGYTPLEWLGTRPTLDVNGILCGFTGAGLKTIIPAKAMAKISMRLVPYQDAEAVEEQLKAYLHERAPQTVRWELKRLTTSAPAVLIERETAGMRAAIAAIEETFEQKPLFQLMGGSVPVVNIVRQVLHADVIMLGFSILSDANVHSPNEHVHLPSYYRGIEAFARFFDGIAQSYARER